MSPGFPHLSWSHDLRFPNPTLILGIIEHVADPPPFRRLDIWMPDIQKQQHSNTIRFIPNLMLVGVVQYEGLALFPLTYLGTNSHGTIALWYYYWEMDAQAQIHWADMGLNRRVGLERAEEAKGEGSLEQKSALPQVIYNTGRLGTVLGKFGLPLTRQHIGMPIPGTGVQCVLRMLPPSDVHVVIRIQRLAHSPGIWIRLGPSSDYRRHVFLLDVVKRCLELLHDRRYGWIVVRHTIPRGRRRRRRPEGQRAQPRQMKEGRRRPVDGRRG
jgi:hypothetical protein